jgi:hypothetical protein
MYARKFKHVTSLVGGKASPYIRLQTVKNLPVAGVLTNIRLEINSAASYVKINIEFRTNSRPERGSYNYFYSFFYVSLIYSSTQTVNVF